MGYAEVKKIYNEYRLDYFVMAISYLMDIGFRNAKEITNKDIEEAEGNGLMTKEFVGVLMKLTRDIANACEPSELIQLCQVVEPFAVPEDLTKERMRRILSNFIEADVRSLKLMVADGTFEPEDLEALGYWAEEDVENYYEEKN